VRPIISSRSATIGDLGFLSMVTVSSLLSALDLIKPLYRQLYAVIGHDIKTSGIKKPVPVNKHRF